jgi:carnitine-CoA ligase
MTCRSAYPPAAQAVTFAQRWAEAVAEARGRIFLVFEDGKGRATTWTYRQWDVLVARTAGRLADLGVEQDTRVHLVPGNSPTFIAVWLACARLGATMVPSDTRAPAQELAAHAKRIRPTVVICTRFRAAENIAAVQRSVMQIDEDDPALGELVRGRRVEGAVVHSARVAGILFTWYDSCPEGRHGDAG